MYLYDFDVFTMPETWLSENIPDSNIQINGYNLIRCDRPLSRGGGVCVYLKSQLNYSVLDLASSSSDSSAHIEAVGILIDGLRCSCDNLPLVIVTAYRPPGYMPSVFFPTLESIIYNIVIMTSSVVCLGDFNVDIGITSTQLSSANGLVADFQKFFNFSQIISEPTRVTATSSSIIDLLFVSDSLEVTDVDVSDSAGISDHQIISCKIKCFPKQKLRHTVMFRDLRSIPIDNFNDVATNVSWDDIFDGQSIDEKVSILASHIVQLIDFCPR